MPLSESKIIQVHKALLELALRDVEALVQLADIDTTQVYVCVERKKGKSFGQIGKAVGITAQSVERRCKKCPQV